MNPNDIYKTILRSITQVRDTKAGKEPSASGCETTHATDALLDEMARNSAHAIVLLLDE